VVDHGGGEATVQETPEEPAPAKARAGLAIAMIGILVFRRSVSNAG
jgi:hypothetical protein